jgi:competence protein ComEA
MSSSSPPPGLAPGPAMRSTALVVMMIIAAAIGVVMRTRGDGDAPGDCPKPALEHGVLRCDGVGEPVGARAWLVGHKLDVNRATTRELEIIPGIGPSLARAIVDKRSELGRFERFEDLDQVTGIGPKTMEKLRVYLEVP